LKNAEERAEELVIKLFPLNDKDNMYSHIFKQRNLIYEITALLKDQDKITRHACAENVSKIDPEWMNRTADGSRIIDINRAHEAIMNTKAI